MTKKGDNDVGAVLRDWNKDAPSTAKVVGTKAQAVKILMKAESTMEVFPRLVLDKANELGVVWWRQTTEPAPTSTMTSVSG